MSAYYRDERTANLVVESPTMPFPTVHRRVAEFAASADWNLYPASPAAVTDRVADHFGVAPSRVRLESGSSSALRELVTATLLSGGRVAYPGEAFGGYDDHLSDVARRRHSAALVDYGLTTRDRRLHDWLDEVSDAGPRLCFVCVPEVPLVDRSPWELMADVEMLIGADPTVHMVLDVAYADWSIISTLLRLTEHLPRVSLVATSSKLLGLAGLRLGFVVLGAETLAEIGYGNLRFPLTALQLAAWDALLDELQRGVDVHDREDLHGDITSELDRLGATRLGEIEGLFVTVGLTDPLPFEELRGKAMRVRQLARLKIDADNLRELRRRAVE